MIRKSKKDRQHNAVIKVYQLLAHGRWFSPGTPASSTNKTGRHNIAEILLKVALNTKVQSSSSSIFLYVYMLTMFCRSLFVLLSLDVLVSLKVSKNIGDSYVFTTKLSSSSLFTTMSPAANQVAFTFFA
jgi:hypothetical protein